MARPERKGRVRAETQPTESRSRPAVLPQDDKHKPEALNRVARTQGNVSLIGCQEVDRTRFSEDVRIRRLAKDVAQAGAAQGGEGTAEMPLRQRGLNCAAPLRKDLSEGTPATRGSGERQAGSDRMGLRRNRTS